PACLLPCLPRCSKGCSGLSRPCFLPPRLCTFSGLRSGWSSIPKNHYPLRTIMTRKDYLYQHYTWPELGEAAKRQPVVVLPIGSVEDHGPHLPLDVDNFLIWSI